jgi:hypothetical protein
MFRTAPSDPGNVSPAGVEFLNPVAHASPLEFVAEKRKK